MIAEKGGGEFKCLQHVGGPYAAMRVRVCVRKGRAAPNRSRDGLNVWWIYQPRLLCRGVSQPVDVGFSHACTCGITFQTCEALSACVRLTELATRNSMSVKHVPRHSGHPNTRPCAYVRAPHMRYIVPECKPSWRSRGA